MEAGRTTSGEEATRSDEESYAESLEGANVGANAPHDAVSATSTNDKQDDGMAGVDLRVDLLRWCAGTELAGCCSCFHGKKKTILVMLLSHPKGGLCGAGQRAELVLPVHESHWAQVMASRRDALRSDEGEWRTDNAECPGCLVHTHGTRIQAGAWMAASSTVVALIVEAATSLITTRQNITLAALDRALVGPLTMAMAAHDYQLSWHSRCGLYRPSSSRDVPQRSALGLASGATLETLRDGDAPLIDERWTYRSATSLDQYVRPMISAKVGCLGIREASALRGWVLRYTDGALGMLWVEEGHRRRGFARRLIAQARSDIEAAGLPCFSYIVDGNVASEALFGKEGWERVHDADWVGFAPIRAGELQE